MADIVEYSDCGSAGCMASGFVESFRGGTNAGGFDHAEEHALRRRRGNLFCGSPLGGVVVFCSGGAGRFAVSLDSFFAGKIAAAVLLQIETILYADVVVWSRVFSVFDVAEFSDHPVLWRQLFGGRLFDAAVFRRTGVCVSRGGAFPLADR